MSIIICSPLETGIVALPSETAVAVSFLSLLPFPGVDSNGGGACAKAVVVTVVDIAATNKTKTKKMVFILCYFATPADVDVVWVAGAVVTADGSTTILDFGKSKLRCVFASIGIVTSPSISFISF